MSESAAFAAKSFEERRKFPRYGVPFKISLAVEDASCGEQIGIGEPSDISLGGAALSLQGEVVHHGTLDTFGVEFQRLSLMDRDDVNRLILRLDH